MATSFLLGCFSAKRIGRLTDRIGGGLDVADGLRVCAMTLLVARKRLVGCAAKRSLAVARRCCSLFQRACGDRQVAQLLPAARDGRIDIMWCSLLALAATLCTLSGCSNTFHHDVRIGAGTAALQNGDFPAAARLFKAAQEDVEHRQESSLAASDVLIRLADVYVAQGLFEKADTLYRRAIKMLTTLPSTNYLAISRAFNRLAACRT